MKFIPSMQVNRIEREIPLMDKNSDIHPLEALRKKSIEEQEYKKIEELKRIRYACLILKTANTEAWKILEESLSTLYEDVKQNDGATVESFINSGMNPQYFPLLKAHSSGQKEILEAILTGLEIKESGSRKEVVKKSFLKKFVDKFVK